MQDNNKKPLSLQRIALATAVSSVMGLSSLSLEANNRIVGGNDAAKNEFPYMAALVNAQQNNAKMGQFCGASIIAPQWAITAAHCVENGQADNIDVLIKTNTLDNGGTRIRATQVYSHSDYAQNGRSDIALIKLSKKADVAAILPLKSGSGLESGGDLATVIGWGLTKQDGQPSNKLMKVNVPIVADSVCEKTYGGQFQAATELCAGLPKGGKDSCQGDSGGPLMVKTKSGTPQLAGIVSWGHGCAQAGKFGVYTQVSAHTDWIDKVLKGGIAADKPNGNSDFGDDMVFPGEIPEPPNFEDDISILPCEGEPLDPDFNLDPNELSVSPSSTVSPTSQGATTADCVIEPIGEFKLDFSQNCNGTTCTFEAKLADSKVKVEEYVWDIIDISKLPELPPMPTEPEIPDEPEYPAPATAKNEQPIPVEPDMPNIDIPDDELPLIEPPIAPGGEDLPDFITWKVGKSIQHKFPSAGKYEIYLNAFSDDGKFGHVYKEVTIGEKAVARAQQSNFSQKRRLAKGEHYISEQAHLAFGQSVNIQIKGPENADFDLYLERLDTASGQWNKVEALTTPLAYESVNTTIRQEGDYRIRVIPYQGAGEFELIVELP